MLSLILLSYQSGHRLESVYERLKTILEPAGIQFELVIIDDSSTDNSWEIAESMQERYNDVTAWQLTRNFTSFYAMYAGLKKCTGSCAMPIPDDGQIPLELIPELYKLWEKGSKVILPYRKNRKENAVARIQIRLVYMIINFLTGYNYPSYGIDSFLIDREIIDILIKRSELRRKFIITEIMSLDYNPVLIPFTRPPDSGFRSRWSLGAKRKLLGAIIFSAAPKPSRVIVLSLMILLCIITICTISLLLLGWIVLQSFGILFLRYLLILISGVSLFLWLFYREYDRLSQYNEKNAPGYQIRE